MRPLTPFDLDRPDRGRRGGGSGLGVGRLDRSRSGRTRPDRHRSAYRHFVPPMRGWRAQRRALGGSVYAGVGLIWLATGPHRPGGAALSTMADWPVQVVIMTSISLAVGTFMGLAAWLAATVMGRSVSSTLPTRNDRFVCNPEP